VCGGATVHTRVFGKQDKVPGLHIEKETTGGGEGGREVEGLLWGKGEKEKLHLFE